MNGESGSEKHIVAIPRGENKSTAYVNSIYYDISMNGGAVPTQNYSYGGLRYAWLQNSTIGCYIQYLDESGVPIANDDTLTLYFMDGAWSPSSSNYLHTDVQGFNNSDSCYLSTTAPVVYGQHSGVGGMYYDSSVGIGVYSDLFGDFILYGDVFVTTRIMP